MRGRRLIPNFPNTPIVAGECLFPVLPCIVPKDTFPVDKSFSLLKLALWKIGKEIQITPGLKDNGTGVLKTSRPGRYNDRAIAAWNLTHFRRKDKHRKKRFHPHRKNRNHQTRARDSGFRATPRERNMILSFDLWTPGISLNTTPLPVRIVVLAIIQQETHQFRITMWELEILFSIERFNGLHFRFREWKIEYLQVFLHPIAVRGFRDSNDIPL